MQNRLVMKWRDLLNRESFDQAVTLMCIDTLPGGTSLGTAMWRGISLKKLLKEVGADEETAQGTLFFVQQMVTTTVFHSPELWRMT